MKKVVVQASRPYDILIRRNIFDSCGDIIASYFSSGKAAVVTDETVFELYGKSLIDVLKKRKFNVKTFKIKPGEQSKNIDNLTLLYDFLNNFGMTRNDFILAFGGGVVGDLAGFAAASFLRGMPLVQMPTTLLAQVDSSVGGKTAINFGGQKNLVGAFYNPSLVICDPDFLKTLRFSTFCDGMAEVIKYAAAFSKPLFEKIQSLKIDDILEDIILQCIILKKNIVEIDENDFRERMKLNFGHTIAHAIEKYNKYENITHGQAVSIGMVYILRQGEKFGLTKKGETQKLINTLRKFRLPIDINIPLREIFMNSLSDKKRRGNKMTVVILPEIGKSRLLTLTPDEYKNFLLN